MIQPTTLDIAANSLTISGITGSSVISLSLNNTPSGIMLFNVDNGTDNVTLQLTSNAFALQLQDDSSSNLMGLLAGVTAGLVVQDDLLSLGMVYATDYSVNGVLNPLWIPNYGAIQDNFVSSANNGLNIALGNIAMGGTLSQTTVVDIQSYELQFIGSSGTNSTFFNMMNFATPTGQWSAINATNSTNLNLTPMFFSISTGATGTTGYNFITESTLGNVLIGIGLTAGQTSLAGASQSRHRIQLHGAIFSDTSIDCSGNVTSFYSSDVRLKENLIKITDALDIVTSLNGYYWKWNDKVDESTKSSPGTGLVAQEVQKVFPEVIRERQDGFLAIDYQKMIGLLVEAIKDLKNITEVQSKEIEMLKKFIDDKNNAIS